MIKLLHAQLLWNKQFLWCFNFIVFVVWRDPQIHLLQKILQYLTKKNYYYSIKSPPTNIFCQTIKKIDLYIWKKKENSHALFSKVSISTHWHNNNAQKMAEVAILHPVSSHLSLIRHHGRREWQNRYKTSPKAFPHSSRFTDLIGYQLDRHRVFNQDTKTDYESIHKLMLFFFGVSSTRFENTVEWRNHLVRYHSLVSNLLNKNENIWLINYCLPIYW